MFASVCTAGRAEDTRSAAQGMSGYVYDVGKTKAHYLLDASEMS